MRKHPNMVKLAKAAPAPKSETKNEDKKPSSKKPKNKK